MSDAGVVFGRYRLVEQLGAGGMARVFRAVIDGPKGFAHELCIKRIRPEHSRNTHFVNMLAREARLCGRLRHPSIVQVHEFGEVDGEYYLAMELVDGYDLLALAKALVGAGRPLPPGVACHIVNELAGALGYAHALGDGEGRSLGVVHRDISPSNVMIGRQGTVKLLDFGIAKAAASAREDLTATGTLKGKISYMSPEQADGLPLDGRSDLFALGVVFHELLTQRRLFRADGDLERLRLVREARVEPPSQLAPDVPPALDAVVLKLLARRREDRYARAEELVADLTPLCSHAGALRQLVGELQPFFAARPGGLLGPEDARQLPVAAAPPELRATVAERLPPSTISGAASRGELQPIDRAPPIAPPPAWRRWTAPALVGAALTLVAAWALGGWRRAPLPPARPADVAASAAPTAAAGELPSPPPTNAAPAPSLPSSVTPPPRPQPVHLRVAGPGGAELFVDGLLVGQLPLDVPLAPIARPRRLLVRKPGFAPWARSVAGDASAALTAKLSRHHAAAAPDEARIYDPFAR